MNTARPTLRLLEPQATTPSGSVAMHYVTTVTEIAIHPIGVNPVYGEGVTRVRLEDEAGGIFLSIVQDNDSGSHRITIDPEELPVLTQAVSTLMQQAATKAE